LATAIALATVLLQAPPVVLKADAKDLRPVLHPKAVALPFSHQGPFVTIGDGGVFCMDAQNALCSRDEGRTWTATPIFRDRNKCRISDERALLRTRDGVVIAAWMNLREQKSPPGWNWGAKDSNWQDFVLPVYVCRSLDDGRTWEEPIFLNKPWCGCIHSIIELWITTMQGGLRMRIHAAELDAGEIPIFKPPVPPPPKPGGIVMFGDSTTAQRPGAVDRVYAERVAEVLRATGSSLSVHNAGVPSNTTRDARDRFARDVLAHKPRVVVIQFGLNDAAVDVWRDPPATAPRVSLAEYEQNLRWMVATLREHHAKPVLMTTNPIRWTPKLLELYGKPPYRPKDADGFDAPLLAQYNQAVRTVARQLNVPLVDAHAAFTAKNADKLLLDGMHPNDAGHQLIVGLLMPVIREQLR
jgi:lysophospholipase L1-like esterase